MAQSIAFHDQHDLYNGRHAHFARNAAAAAAESGHIDQAQLKAALKAHQAATAAKHGGPSRRAGADSWENFDEKDEAPPAAQCDAQHAALRTGIASLVDEFTNDVLKARDRLLRKVDEMVCAHQLPTPGMSRHDEAVQCELPPPSGLSWTMRLPFLETQGPRHRAWLYRRANSWPKSPATSRLGWLPTPPAA